MHADRAERELRERWSVCVKEKRGRGYTEAKKRHHHMETNDDDDGIIATTLTRTHRERLRVGADCLQARNVLHVERPQQVHRVLVHLNAICVQSRDLRDVVHSALPLLLLQLERDAANWASRNALHEMLYIFITHTHARTQKEEK